MGADKESGFIMNISRNEIMPGVFLNCLKSEKFKTSFMSVNLLNQLTRETASINALIPFVLKRGTVSCPDMESLGARLDELYGAVIEPVVRLTGEIQGIGLIASFPEEKYLPKGSSVTSDVINLLAEMLLMPNMKGGLFRPDYVESEKENLADLIRSAVNEKRSYAVQRCVEEMCCYEDIAAGKFGKAEDVEGINYIKLTKQYHDVLKTSPVEIFYFGQESEQKIKACVEDAFCTMPRGDIDYDIGTDIRMNSVEDEPRYFEENMDVTQGKLVLGFRLGECMEDPDIPSIRVFNAVYGSGVNSKLFTNVREKLQLCYYASSRMDINKGILLAMSGIDFDRYEDAKDEILRQLDNIRCGDISDEEMQYAKAGIMSDMKALTDSQYGLESFFYSNLMAGYEWTPEELCELISEVTKEDVINVASGVVLDLVYFLRDKKDD